MLQGRLPTRASAAGQRLCRTRSRSLALGSLAAPMLPLCVLRTRRRAPNAVEEPLEGLVVKPLERPFPSSATRTNHFGPVGPKTAAPSSLLAPEGPLTPSLASLGLRALAHSLAASSRHACPAGDRESPHGAHPAKQPNYVCLNLRHALFLAAHRLHHVSVGSSDH